MLEKNIQLKMDRIPKRKIDEEVYILIDRTIYKTKIRSIYYSIKENENGFICSGFGYNFLEITTSIFKDGYPDYYPDESLLFNTYEEADKHLRDKLDFKFVDMLKEEE